MMFLPSKKGCKNKRKKYLNHNKSEVGMAI